MKAPVGVDRLATYCFLRTYRPRDGGRAALKACHCHVCGAELAAGGGRAVAVNDGAPHKDAFLCKRHWRWLKAAEAKAKKWGWTKEPPATG